MESKNNEMINNENNNSKNESWKKDPYTLRVRGGNPNEADNTKKPTDPLGLSRSILHVLAENEDGYVRLLSVGDRALHIAMRAFRIAAEEIEAKQHGAILVVRQSEYMAEINGTLTRGICTRIFAIPVKDAR